MKKIISEEVIFDHGLVVEEATISDKGKKYRRQRLKRSDAACVLLFNKDKGKFILTRQFRYAATAWSDEELLEIPAGKLDKGEQPEDAAVRECEEETGYRIGKNALVHIATCFVSPGYSTERFHLFYAEVADADKKSEGGGLQDEHEGITIVEMEESRFLELVEKGEIKDSKTFMAGLWYGRRKSGG